MPRGEPRLPGLCHAKEQRLGRGGPEGTEDAHTKWPIPTAEHTAFNKRALSNDHEQKTWATSN